jgi:AraC-like DNA-binding protein
MTLYLALLNMILALILLMFNWKVNRNALFLSVLMILIASGQARQYLVLHYANEPFWLAILINNPGPLWSMIGPCLFFYVRSVLTDSFEFRRSDLLHTLPFWLNLVGIFPYLITPFSYKLEVAQLFIDRIPAENFVRFNWMMNHEWNLMSRYVVQIGYSLVCLGILVGFQRGRMNDPNRPLPNSGLVHKWLVGVSVFVLLKGLYYFTGTFLYFRNPTLGRNMVSSYNVLYAFGIVLTCLPALVLIFPEILYGIPRRREGAETTNSLAGPLATLAAPAEEADNAIPDTDPEAPSLPEDAADDTFREMGQRVLNYMEREKPYLQPDFSIEQLAEILDVPRHHLYYCFKNILQKKFVTLRTEYRVRYAKRRLLEADLKDTTMDAIGRESGFSSHSAFYRGFAEQTGCTPREFVERNQPQGRAAHSEVPKAGQSALGLG